MRFCIQITKTSLLHLRTLAIVTLPIKDAGLQYPRLIIIFYHKDARRPAKASVSPICLPSFPIHHSADRPQSHYAPVCCPLSRIYPEVSRVALTRRTAGHSRPLSAFRQALCAPRQQCQSPFPQSFLPKPPPEALPLSCPLLSPSPPFQLDHPPQPSALLLHPQPKLSYLRPEAPAPERADNEKIEQMILIQRVYNESLAA